MYYVELKNTKHLHLQRICMSVDVERKKKITYEVFPFVFTIMPSKTTSPFQRLKTYHSRKDLLGDIWVRNLADYDDSWGEFCLKHDRERMDG